MLRDTFKKTIRPSARPRVRLWIGHIKVAVSVSLAGGCPAAHERHLLMLLGSPPDMVRGLSLRRTARSAAFRHRRYTYHDPGTVFSPAVADCGYREPLLPRIAETRTRSDCHFDIILYSFPICNSQFDNNGPRKKRCSSEAQGFMPIVYSAYLTFFFLSEMPMPASAAPAARIRWTSPSSVIAFPVSRSSAA